MTQADECVGWVPVLDSVLLRAPVSYGIECTETGQPDNELQGSRWLGHEVQRENGPSRLVVEAQGTVRFAMPHDEGCHDLT